MKKLLLLKLLALVACLSSALSATAYSFKSGGIYYNITSSTNKTVEVTYSGNSSSTPDYTGALTIPSTVTYGGVTFTVTAIGEEAFANYESAYQMSQITSISLPNTIISIGNSAFQRNGITAITLPSSLQTIGEYAFYRCISLKSISIPNSVTSLGTGAFSNCWGLQTINLGSGITSIPAYCFNACDEALTSVTIPNQVYEIGDYAFYNCKLETVTLGFGVETIGDYAFYESHYYLNDVYCYALEPPTIQSNTFYGTYTYSPTLHTLVYSNDFYKNDVDWKKFSTITTISGNTAYDAQIGGLYYAFRPYPSSNAFYARVTNNGNYNCYTNSSYSVPATVTWRGQAFKVDQIWKNAFRGSTSVNTLDLSNATNLTSIVSYACYGCTGLTTVYLSPSITTIEDYAFYNSGLSKLYTNNSTPPTIYSNTFSTRYNYCYVYVPYPRDIATYQAAPYWSNFRMILSEQNYDFVSGGIYYRITGSNTVEVTCEDPDNHCSYTGNVSVPATVTWNGTTYNVTAIGEWAFSEARQVNLTAPAGTSQRGYTPGSLKSVSLPSSVTIIKPYAFSWCTGLTQVSIGSGVTTIDDYAFYYSTALTTITIPNSVTTLGQSVFGGCSALKNVTLGSGLNSIGNYAFDGCTALEFVNCLKTTAPTIQSNTFTSSQYNTVKVIVPNDALGSYFSTTWKNFTNVNTIDQWLAGHVQLSGDVTLTTSGAYPWVIYRNYKDSGGSYICATSSNSGQHSTSSVMTGTATVPANNTGTLTFDFKAWGEGTSSLYDKCIFAVDGVTKFTYGARDYDWESYTVELPAGTHTLTWTYQKDGSVNPTGDYFAVDNVKLVTQASVVTGDVNGDGSTTIADVTALIDSLLSGVEVPLDAADVNGDGSVTIADVTALIDMLLGS